MKYVNLNFALCIMNYALNKGLLCPPNLALMIGYKESVEDFVCLFILIEALQSPTQNKQPTPTLCYIRRPLARGGYKQA